MAAAAAVAAAAAELGILEGGATRIEREGGRVGGFGRGGSLRERLVRRAMARDVAVNRSLSIRTQLVYSRIDVPRKQDVRIKAAQYFCR